MAARPRSRLGKTCMEEEEVEVVAPFGSGLLLQGISPAGPSTTSLIVPSVCVQRVWSVHVCVRTRVPQPTCSGIKNATMAHGGHVPCGSDDGVQL
jgi:hypothetical protein